MLKKIEKFLQSKYYIALIFGITGLSWLIRGKATSTGFHIFNMIGTVLLLVIFVLISSFYKNSLYTIPIVLCFSYIVNNTSMNMDTTSSMFFLAILILYLLGLIIHSIRFGVNYQRGGLTLGLLFIAFANIFPLGYVEIHLPLIIFSLVGFHHFVLYQYFRNNTKIKDVDYYMSILYAVSILMVFETFCSYLFYLNDPSLVAEADLVSKYGSETKALIAQGIRDSWSHDFGWGVINDAMLHLLLSLPAHVYFILKSERYNILRFIPIVIIAFVFSTSGSRGGQLGLLIETPLLIGIIIYYGNRKTRLNLLYMFIAFFGILFLFPNMFSMIIKGFQQSLNNPLTGRNTLWKQGWETFKEYPVCGGGWYANTNDSHGGRAVIYHSTVFHTLAVMGIVGMAATILNWWESIKIMFQKIRVEHLLIFVGYLATFIVGMMDITQHAMFFMPILNMNLMFLELAPIKKWHGQKRYFGNEPKLKLKEI